MGSSGTGQPAPGAPTNVPQLPYGDDFYGTLSGLGNFNPGGLGGPRMNSPYWQPPQQQQQQMPMPGGPSMSAASMPGGPQQGLLAPAMLQPMMTDRSDARRFFRRYGEVPSQLMQSPYGAMAGPMMGAMTPGAYIPMLQTSSVPARQAIRGMY